MSAGMFDRPTPAPRPVWCCGYPGRPPHTSVEHRRLEGGVLLCPECDAVRAKLEGRKEASR